MTQVDLDEIEKIVDEKVGEKTKYLPTKEEYFATEDKIMGELKSIREEVTIMADLQRQVHDHEDRTERVEEKLQIQSSL